MSKPSFADVMASPSNGRRTATTRVCFSPDINQQYAELAVRLEDALESEQRTPRHPDDKKVDTTRRLVATEPESTKIAQQMADLVENNPTAFYEVKLEQATRPEWLALRAQHAPRDGVVADRGAFNADTFPPAAVRLSLVDPEPTDEVMAFLTANLSSGEWERLTGAVWDLNEGAREVPDPKALMSLIRSGNAAS